MSFDGTILLDSVDVTDQMLEAITITAGRTTFIDPIAPSSASGVFMSDALTATTGIGSTVQVTVRGYVRFTGTITNISRGRYHTSWTATSSALGPYAKVLAPEFTVRQIPSSFGLRIPYLTYTVYDVLYQAGVMSDAQFQAAANVDVYSQPIGHYLTVGTDFGSFKVQRDIGELHVGATIPAGTVLDQLNYLAAHRRPSAVHEYPNTTTPAITFLREYTSAIPTSAAYVSIDTDTTQTLELMANKTKVTYRTGSLSVTEINYTSAAAYGLYSLDVATAFYVVTDAQDLAHGLTGGRYKPRWLTVPLIIDLNAIPSLTYPVYANSPNGRSYDLSALEPYIGADYLPSAGFLEGYVETITASSHTLEAYIFDVIYTRDSEQWYDVTPTLTWAATDPNLTWYDMIGAIL